MLCSTRGLHLNLGHLSLFKKCRGRGKVGQQNSWPTREAIEEKGHLPTQKDLFHPIKSWLGGYSRVFSGIRGRSDSFKGPKHQSGRQTLPRNPSSFRCIQLMHTYFLTRKAWLGVLGTSKMVWHLASMQETNYTQLASGPEERGAE